MKYDLTKAEHRLQLKERVGDALQRGSSIVEFREVKPQRTMQQNRYLHLIISFFASEYGETSEYVKEQYFKLAANRALFLVERDDPLAGKVRYLRSTRDLDTEEMRLAIERFRNWASASAGIYLPSANEQRLLDLADIEVSRNKEYI